MILILTYILRITTKIASEMKVPVMANKFGLLSSATQAGSRDAGAACLV